MLASAIQQHAAGQKVRRLTLLSAMNKSPASSATRSLITNSGKYGLTIGGYEADTLELTPQGKLATSPDGTERERVSARYRLAIDGIGPFKPLIEGLFGGKIPNTEILIDRVPEQIPDQADRAQCVDIFLSNARFLGLVKVLSGAERVVSLDHVLEELPAGSPS